MRAWALSLVVWAVLLSGTGPVAASEQERSAFELAARSGARASLEGSDGSVPAWVEANYRHRSGVGIGLFGDLARVFNEADTAVHRGFGAQALLSGPARPRQHAWVGVTAGCGWYYEATEFDVPTRVFDGQDTTRVTGETELHRRPEVGMQAGVDFGLWRRLWLGPYVASCAPME